MEWVDTITFIIGLIILGWYQNARIRTLDKEIGSLKNVVTSQGALLDNFKTYFETFDPKRIQAVLNLTEKKKDMEKEMEINKTRAQFERNLEEEKGLRDSLEEQLKQTQSQKEKLFGKVEIAASERSDLEKKYRITLINIADLRVFLLKYAYLTNTLYRLSITRVMLSVYSHLKIDEKYADAPKTIEIENKLEKLHGYFSENLELPKPLIEWSFDASQKQFNMSEKLDQSKTAECGSELDSIKESFSPLLDRFFKSKNTLPTPT